MKLNNQQITALANKFYNEAKEKQELKNEAKEKELQKKYKPLYDKGIQLLKNNSSLLHRIELNVGKRDSASLVKDETFESFVTNYSIRKLIKNQLKEKTLDVDTIKEDIVLATIDSNSVEDIMKTLNAKYK